MSATLDTFGLNVDRKEGFLLCTANNVVDPDTTGNLIYFPIGDLGNPQFLEKSLLAWNISEEVSVQTTER